VASLVHDGAFRHATYRRRGGQSSTQAVAGEAYRIQAGPLRPALHHARHAAVGWAAQPYPSVSIEAQELAALDRCLAARCGRAPANVRPPERGVEAQRRTAHRRAVPLPPGRYWSGAVRHESRAEPMQVSSSSSTRSSSLTNLANTAESEIPSDASRSPPAGGSGKIFGNSMAESR
jgi:hypothetical protein